MRKRVVAEMPSFSPHPKAEIPPEQDFPMGNAFDLWSKLQKLLPSMKKYFVLPVLNQCCASFIVTHNSSTSGFIVLLLCTQFVGFVNLICCRDIVEITVEKLLMQCTDFPAGFPTYRSCLGSQSFPCRQSCGSYRCWSLRWRRSALTSKYIFGEKGLCSV